MNKRGIFACLVTALFCSGIFLGCVSVPQEALDEKEAVIQNLNSQIENLKQEAKRLQDSNDELMKTRAGLEERLSEVERTQQDLENKLKEKEKHIKANAEQASESNLK